MSEPARSEPPERSLPAVRASDAERELVAEMVRRAVGDGRLTLAEGDERLAAVYAATHRGDLVAHVGDLDEHDPFAPASAPSRSARLPASTRPSTTTTVALMSGTTRAGDWTPGSTHTAVAVMGGVELAFTDARLDGQGLTIVAVAWMGGVDIDLRGADIGPDGVTIRAVTIMGGVDVVVDPDTRVVENGVAVMGGFEDSSGAPTSADGPVVRVTGFALMGGVDVSRRPLGVDDEGNPELPGDDDDRPRGLHGGA